MHAAVRWGEVGKISEMIVSPTNQRNRYRYRKNHEAIQVITRERNFLSNHGSDGSNLIFICRSSIGLRRKPINTLINAASQVSIPEEYKLEKIDEGPAKGLGKVFLATIEVCLGRSDDRMSLS